MPSSMSKHSLSERENGISSFSQLSVVKIGVPT